MESASKSNSRLAPSGHVGTTALTIGAMALVVGIGLGVLGFADRLNALIAQAVPVPGEARATLPPVVILLAVALCAFGPAYVLLVVPGQGRRVVLWLAACALTFTWAPVLALAHFKPEVALPLVSVIWSGLCSLVYTSSHRMPCDSPSTTHGPR